MHRREFLKVFRAPSLAESLAKRCEIAKTERHEKQKNSFWQKRIQEMSSTSTTERVLPAKPKNSRAEMLKAWKAEKLKKLEEEKNNKKPIFKVGIVHRKATGSPILKPDPVNIKTKPKQVAVRDQGVVTRSRAKNLCKELDIKTKKQSKSGFCKVQNGKMKTISKHEFKVPESVAELQNKIENFSSSNSICEKSTVEKVKNEEEKENTPETRSSRNRSVVIKVEPKILEQTLPFRKYIENETKRLLDTAEKWKHIYEEFEEVPPEIEGDIDSVAGKTKLLTSDKFMQFQDLIDKCEKGDPLIKIDDLKGFQDWVSIEVERINEEFERLEKKKLNNWIVEPDPVVVNKKVAVKKAAKKPVGKSNILAHIKAARKQMKNTNPTDTSNFIVDVKEKTPRKPVLRDILNVTANVFSPNKMSPVPERKSARLANSGKKRVTIVDSANATPNFQSLSGKRGRSIRKTPMPSRVTPHDKENSVVRRRGLDEKYFRPVEDEQSSPLCLLNM